MLGIIIPIYKARDTLPKALDSLVAQTKTMFLVTLVQDCDGEDYSDIIEEYKRRGLHISLVQMEKNVGPGLARQRGIDVNERCEYLMFLDSDDMLLPEAVEVLTREISVNKADIAASSIIAEMPHKPSMPLPVETTPVQWMHGKCYRRQYLVEKNIRFLDEVRLNEDSYFNLVAFNGTEKHIRIPKETYLWRYNKNSLTRTEEDDGDFFARSWDQYLLSQVRGIKKLYEVNKIPDQLLGATLINIYTHYMKAFHFKQDTSKVDWIFNELAHIDEMWAQLDNKPVWEYINANLKCSDIENDTMYFFRMRFIDWLEYVKKVGRGEHEDICD